MARGVRSDGRREEIISAAAELFGKVGYHQTSMEDIADAVGISKPTLYHYTKSKSEIVFWIHDKIADRMVSSLEASIESGLPPHERLWHVIHETLLVMESEPGHLAVFFEHYRDLAPTEQAVAKKKRDHYYDLVVQSIRDGVDDGSLVSDDPVLTAFGLFGMTNWAYQWFRPGAGRTSAEVAEHLWGLLMRGLATDGLRKKLSKDPRQTA